MLATISLIVLTLTTSSFVRCVEDESADQKCNTYDISIGAAEAIKNIIGHGSLFTCPDTSADLSKYVDLIFVNGGRKKIISMSDDITIKEIKKKLTIAMLIHGFLDSTKSPWMGEISDGQNDIMGVSGATIMLDYSPISYCDYYKVAKEFLPLIGEYVANKINAIHPTAEIICVGHSLGAHLCSIIALHLLKKPTRIVGLDPAGPLFLDGDPFRLRPTSAETVIAMHTNPLVFGTTLQSGTVDYHVKHWLLGQPYCFESICSHVKAIDYWNALLKAGIEMDCPSIVNENMGKKCQPGFKNNQTGCTGRHLCKSNSRCFPYFLPVN